MSGRIFTVYEPLLRRAHSTLLRRFVSTSKKNNETATATAEACKPKTKSKEPEDWVSYGFHRYSKEEDRSAFHSNMFVSVSLCLVVGGFFYMYYPDVNLRDWSQREAYLELRRRENAGKPLIDRNYIDPAKIVLPSDEELGNTEIII